LPPIRNPRPAPLDEVITSGQRRWERCYDRIGKSRREDSAFPGCLAFPVSYRFVARQDARKSCVSPEKREALQLLFFHGDPERDPWRSDYSMSGHSPIFVENFAGFIVVELSNAALSNQNSSVFLTSRFSKRGAVREDKQDYSIPGARCRANSRLPPSPPPPFHDINERRSSGNGE